MSASGRRVVFGWPRRTSAASDSTFCSLRALRPLQPRKLLRLLREITKTLDRSRSLRFNLAKWRRRRIPSSKRRISQKPMARTGQREAACLARVSRSTILRQPWRSTPFLLFHFTDRWFVLFLIVINIFSRSSATLKSFVCSAYCIIAQKIFFSTLLD